MSIQNYKFYESVTIQHQPEANSDLPWRIHAWDRLPGGGDIPNYRCPTLRRFKNRAAAEKHLKLAAKKLGAEVTYIGDSAHRIDFK